MYEGAIIKETLTDVSILDCVTIEKAEVWKTGDELKYWTVIFFKSETADFPDMLADVLQDGWFADMKQGGLKIIVFNDAILEYAIGNAEEKEEVLNECRARGIPEEQLVWSE